MKCKDFKKRVLEYRAGAPDDELAADMRIHIESCEACFAELADLEAETRIYQEYRDTVERDLTIGAAMWPEIERRIAMGAGGVPRSSVPTPATRRGWSDFLTNRVFLRQAAFAAALVILSVSATLVAVHHFGPVGPGTAGGPPDSLLAPTAVRTGSSEKSLEGAMRAIRKAEQDYLDAIGVLTEIVDKRKPSLDPQLALQLEVNLKAIDEGIEATRRAYYAHPSDPYLALYMLTSYSKKVELLQEMAS